MSEHNYEELAILYLCGELPDSEREAFELLLRDEEPVRQIYLETCQVLWAAGEGNAVPVEVAASVSAARQFAPAAGRKLGVRHLFRGVAVCLGLVAGFVMLNQVSDFRGASEMAEEDLTDHEQEIQRVSTWLELQEQVAYSFEWDVVPSENSPGEQTLSSTTGNTDSEEIEGTYVISAENSVSELPDWLITAVELKQVNASAQDSDPHSPAPLPGQTEGEAL